MRVNFMVGSGSNLEFDRGEPVTRFVIFCVPFGKNVEP